MKHLLSIAVAGIALAAIGCTVRTHTVRYYDDDPYDHYDVYVDHVCSHDCHDHYWDGRRIVTIGSRHRHHSGCGHHWDGRHWVIIRDHHEPDIVISKAPARRVHEPPARVRKAPHVHSVTCGCAWDRRDRVWVTLEDGHVHSRHCGHVNVNGKWCLPR